MSSLNKKIRKFVSDFSKKSVKFRKIVRKINRKRNSKIYEKFYRDYTVDDKVILFEAFGGRNYTCSPKAIYEKMITMDEFQDYKMVWAFIDPSKHEVMPFKNLEIVVSGSKEYYKYCSMAKYWIVNSIMRENVKKKDNQIYVQCWHGTPLKKLRYDIEVTGAALNTIEEIRYRNDIDASRFDYFISPSKYCTEKFTSAFNLKKLGKEDIIIEKGYPRNDFLFNKTKKDIDKIKKKLGIPKNKKVIFYLPTFRDNQHTSGVGYTYNLSIDFDSLAKKFKKEYVILFSPHYFISNTIDLSKYKGFIINVAKYDEINELYLVSDIIMTDYSSVFFDYANLKKPMLFYMYDYDDYKGNLRDFYISLDELPGPIAKTQEELEYNLENIDKIFKKYQNKYKKFNEKYNYLDDGNASERVINEIFKLKKKKKVILTYGTYDLITAGHIEHFRDAKAMGDYLIVGVSTDEFNTIKNKKSYLTYEERKFIVESIKYVDKVIPEEKWEQKRSDIKKYNVDMIVMGSDWEGDERFESLKKYCDVTYTKRPGKWSSTEFRKHVDEYVKKN